jgi:hypothetical protein
VEIWRIKLYKKYLGSVSWDDGSSKRVSRADYTEEKSCLNTQLAIVV